MAASFIWENNPYAKQWGRTRQDVEDSIRDFIIECATRNMKRLELSIKLGKEVDEWDSYCGTGGYYITMHEDTETDNDNVRTGPLSVRVDILVDPAVGIDRLGSHYQKWQVDR